MHKHGPRPGYWRVRQLRPGKTTVVDGHVADAVIEWCQDGKAPVPETVYARPNKWGRADLQVRIAGKWQTWTRVVAAALELPGWGKLARSDSDGWLYQVDGGGK